MKTLSLCVCVLDTKLLCCLSTERTDEQVNINSDGELDIGEVQEALPIVQPMFEARTFKMKDFIAERERKRKEEAAKKMSFMENVLRELKEIKANQVTLQERIEHIEVLVEDTIPADSMRAQLSDIKETMHELCADIAGLQDA